MSKEMVALLISLETIQDQLNAGLISEQEFIRCTVITCDKYYSLVEQDDPELLIKLDSELEKQKQEIMNDPNLIRL